PTSRRRSAATGGGSWCASGAATSSASPAWRTRCASCPRSRKACSTPRWRACAPVSPRSGARPWCRARAVAPPSSFSVWASSAALWDSGTGGQTWGRAAGLKAGAVAGDRALGERLIAELMPFVYRRYLDFGTLEDLEAMKRRVDASLRGPQAARDVKLGRGGIREVEFFVQAQQLVHGGKDPRVQVRSTLGALAALAATGYVEPALAASLAAAYRFLRDVEHKLQIVQERRTQSVPSDPDALLALARRLGFRGAGAAAEFE